MPQHQDVEHSARSALYPAGFAQEIPTHVVKPDSEKTLDDLEPLPPGSKPEWPIHHLVRLAIQGSPEKKLRLSEIYKVLSEKYEYFKTHDNPWRNTVRHTLSNHTLFQKVPKPESLPGKGSYWVVDQDAIPGEKRPRKRGKRGKSTLTLEKSDSDEPTSPETSTENELTPSAPTHTFVVGHVPAPTGGQGPSGSDALSVSSTHHPGAMTYADIFSSTTEGIYAPSRQTISGLEAHGLHPTSGPQHNDQYSHLFGAYMGSHPAAAQTPLPLPSSYSQGGPHPNYQAHLGQPHHLHPRSSLHSYNQSTAMASPGVRTAQSQSQVTSQGSQILPPSSMTHNEGVAYTNQSHSIYEHPAGAISWPHGTPGPSGYPLPHSIPYQTGFMNTVSNPSSSYQNSGFQSTSGSNYHRNSMPHPGAAGEGSVPDLTRRSSEPGPSGGTSYSTTARYNPYGYQSHPQSARRYQHQDD
ncbi:forkhead box protein [Tulasnella sp. 418]|nr:forkhead box protein [Tulasnella sp. 418]